MVTVVLSILIFMLFGIGYAIFIYTYQAQKKNRMMSVLTGGAVQDKKHLKNSPHGQKKLDLSKKLKDENEDTTKTKKKAKNLALALTQAGLEISVKEFWMFSAVCGVLVTMIIKIMGASTFVVVMAAITSFLGLPRLFIRFRIKRRQKQFMDDFADSLESMMRLLKAGMPVSEAIKMVAREFSGPMGEEMGRIFDQQKIGVPLPEAVLDAAQRVPLTEMQMFATAIAIQTQTGSSLSEVLQNLANVIRARFGLKRKVQALSSEAKASAMIIGALPVLVGLGLYFVNPSYIELLFTDSTGKFLLGCAVAWMCVGVLVMRQMINFKV
ncbi:MAG: type II secretion system F family protein [Alphaproteobacteria bacterium]|nr:type II secretion system F family protein [Alphaproteobacteria bacterium]